MENKMENNKILEKLNKISEKISSNKYLDALSKAFQIYMPLSIIGSFASLFNSLLCSTTNGLAKFSGLSFLEKLSPAFSAVYFVCISCMSLFIAYIYGEQLGSKNKLAKYRGGITSLVSFIAVIPHFTTAKEGETAIKVVDILTANGMGARTLFTAFIVAIISVELVTVLSKIDILRIKLPDSVPENTYESFNILIPQFITVLAVSLFACIFELIFKYNFSETIYNVIQIPLKSVINTPIGATISYFAISFFWVIGVHGGAIVAAVLRPFWYENLAANIAAVEAGKHATEFLTLPFGNTFSSIGGNGNVLGLVLAILLFSKRKDHREVAKVGFIPSMFSISEPIMFGLPIVFNFLFAIPFCIAPLVGQWIGRFAIATGFINGATVNVPTAIPVPFRAFLSFGGDFKALFLHIVVIVISILIYTPFVLIANKQKEK